MSLTWVPNALTLSRCGLALGVGWAILRWPEQSYLPFLAFGLVAATDFLDGWAARRLDAVSPFGAFLDPVADKLLVGAALVALCLLHPGELGLLIPSAAIIARDTAATLLRLVPGLEMPVSQLAKWKTAVEMIGIGALLLATATVLPVLWPVGLGLVWLAAALSVYTLGLYIGALIAQRKRPHS
ncbi:MAG: CDP-alcohol phosphatidyltransferase family protein [Pseudomonadota bacterium]